MAKKVLSKIGSSLETRIKLGSAEVSRSPEAALSTITEVKNFYRTGRGLYHKVLVQKQSLVNVIAI